MNKFIFIYMFFISIWSFAQNPEDIKQTIRYQYELTARTSKNNPKTIRQTTCILDIIGDTSICYDQNKYARNKILLYPKPELTKQENAGLMLSIRPVFKWMIISQNNTNKHLDILDYDFKYMTVEPLDEIKWNIDSETSLWHNYTVQKATATYAGRDWTVLFTQDILVKLGPYKFNNLPGLVVKAWDSEDHFIFELLSSKKAEIDLTVIAENEYVETDKKDIMKAIRISNNKTYIQALEEKGHKLGEQERVIFNIKQGDSRNTIERF